MTEHTALDLGQLSPAAQKALGAGPARMMAARGLVPLPPNEQIAVLYQLAIDGDAALASAAKATAIGLPEKLLAGALADPRVDPRVLDLFAQLVGDKPFAFEALVGNPAIADPTIAKLAERAALQDQLERIAANEQRMLRHPEIIAAMYVNKHARMSTVDRVVELAVRNDVRVPGLAAWDEIARALQGAPPSTADVDAMFARAADAIEGDDSALTQGDAEQVLEDTHDAGRDLPVDQLTVPAKIRLAIVGNAFARGALVRDPLKIVAVSAIKSPGVTEFEAARYASNQTLAEDVIRFIANKREWTKLYSIKISLCRNPKTPVTDAMRLLPFLREKDLTVLSRSKGVPSAVVAQARKLLMQRHSQGPKK